jgi:hypothetical protein
MLVPETTSAEGLERFVRRQCLFHPRGEAWRDLMIQLPLFGLLAVAVFLLTDGLRGRVVLLSRIALGFFVIFYTALDSLAGLAVGFLVRYGLTLPPEQRQGVASAAQALWDDRSLGGIFSVVAVVGNLGWLIAMLAAAVARYKAAAPRPAVVLLVSSAIVFALGHPRPFGPIGMALFVAGAIWLEIVSKRIETDKL